MSIHPDDQKEYDAFLQERVKALGSLSFEPGTLIWHYTDGPGLIGILESGTLFSTQVSCLNDSSEIRYASSLFKNALVGLLTKYSADAAIQSFLKKYLKLLEEEPDHPTHAPSPFFVTCFSAQEDDLTQWRSYSGGENGYAIGFIASSLFTAPDSLLVRVNYDRQLHETLASEIGEATVRFFRSGLDKKRAETPEKWEEEFFNFWDPYITRIAPMVKDHGFRAENEYRVIHEFRVSELMHLKMIQKKSMMTRHLPLIFPRGGEAWVPRLPITKIIVGPCRHREITRISVDTLLRKMGYGTGKVTASQRPFQET